MAVSDSDIRSFTDFLRQQANGSADLTISQIAAKWERTRETAEVVAAVNQGRAEFAAGGGRPAAEVVAEIREELTKK